MFIQNLLRLSVIVVLAISASAGQAENKKPKPPADKDTTAPVAKKLSQRDIEAALNTLENVFAAYTQGDKAKFESLTDPRMIGRGVLIDLARQSYNKNKQIRITLLDTKHSSGEAALFIQTNWIKHFLALPGLTAMKQSGESTFVITKNKETWYLSAVSGDNIFRSE